MIGRAKLPGAIAWLIAILACACIVRADEAPPASEVKPPAAEEIAAWIIELDDAHYAAREQATQRLLTAGAAALDPLLAVANGVRPEPADRAVWIMRSFGRSRDNELAVAALERLVQLQGRPSIVANAESKLAELSILACQQRLSPLGADVGLQLEQIATAEAVPVLTVRLNEKWHGVAADLRQVSQLRQQLHFRLEGAPVGDDMVNLFAEKEKLAYLQLFDTKVTPAAVDAVKKKHPDAIVYVRNQALLGVSAENHAAGVLVMFVQPGSAAATAGILPGDIIASLDGHKLPDFDRLTVHVAQHQPGDKIDVEIVRNEKRMTLKVVLGSRAGQE